MTRAGIYCRISSDREHDGLGVARQEADCRTLIEQLGWDPVHAYIDNDKSAYSGKRRPEYEAMLAAVEQQQLDAIVAWHPDRLHRSPKELERFIDLVERNRVQVATVQAGHVDLTTPTGRMTARVVGAVARHESEHKSERVRRKHLEIARAGKISGGHRAYGYRNVHDTAGKISHLELVPHEVDLIHEAIRRVLDGQTVTAIIIDWNRRKIPTTTGRGYWATGVLRRLLAGPHLAGIRTHKGETVGPADWPAIIDYDTHLKLKATLDQRAIQPPTRPRSYLLSGYIYCGKCGAKMHARPAAGHIRRYICSVDRGGCNGVGIIADQLEALICDAALEVLDGPRFVELVSRPVERSDDAAAEIAEVDARTAQLAELWASGGLSTIEWGIAKEGLAKRRQAAQERIAATVDRGDLAELIGRGADLRAMWDSFDFAKRRAVLVAVIERVTVSPTQRANNRFDPRRVAVDWRL